ncbi:MAG: hypothetical protein ABH829_00660 [archaeon]
MAEESTIPAPAEAKNSQFGLKLELLIAGTALIIIAYYLLKY